MTCVHGICSTTLSSWEGQDGSWPWTKLWLQRRSRRRTPARPVPPQWVFGAVDLTTVDFFMELVAQRNGATLIPIIQRNVVPGSRVWSDEWAAYNGLIAAGYQHETVNHSRHFVHPITGVHTNNIEARWAACKATMKCRYGVPRHLLPGYLDEYMWRARHPRPNTLNDILDVIRRRYPV